MSESRGRTVLVTGATGLVGTRLLPVLRQDGFTVRGLSRSPERARSRDADTEWFEWDGVSPPLACASGARAVIHLAGEPVFGGLPTRARLARIRSSRIDSTRALVAVLNELPAEQRPRTLIHASAVGYYGSRGDEMLDESSSMGTGLLAELCRDWEAAAREAEQLSLRVVSIRIGIVLAREGGALVPMARAFRLGVGGRLGSGRQWFPWVHVEDLVRLIGFVLRMGAIEGPVNAVAPGLVRNAELTRVLARILRRPALLPVPAFLLRAALGEISGELLGSRRVVSRRALEAGFRFETPQLEAALRAELG